MRNTPSALLAQGARLWVELPTAICVLSALAHSSIIRSASYHYPPSSYLITRKPQPVRNLCCKEPWQPCGCQEAWGATHWDQRQRLPGLCWELPQIHSDLSSLRYRIQCKGEKCFHWHPLVSRPAPRHLISSKE